MDEVSPSALSSVLDSHIFSEEDKINCLKGLLNELEIEYEGVLA